MSWLLSITCVLVCGPELLQGRASEYQLESETLSPCELLRNTAVAKQRGVPPQCREDGAFRTVQCSGRGQECWCVDAEGQEVVGTRTNSSAVHCASPCQLQSVLSCAPSGEFESIQCDSSRGQCWCVDQDGMELYGTRQSGTPRRCPGSCEVRERRLLHGRGSLSPPQCAADGNFLPVQCQFINTTDRTQLDLLQVFNRFPEAFETFSGFRKFFPMVSSYCYCSDSRGRELKDTGVELLLSEVLDSLDSGLGSVRSFGQTRIYGVLKRRILGLRLALTGRFRCPSPCEEERRAATEASGVLVPSCESGGAFVSTQCDRGGRCWCVDPTGREVPGTRPLGDARLCSSGPLDCPAQRRLALSRLFSGPVEPPLPRASSSRSPVSCISLLRPLQDLLPVEMDPTDFLSRLLEVLHGLFPSVGGAVQALSGASSRGLQVELFGGMFLRSAASFNLSGAVGAQGPLDLSTIQLQRNRDLVRSVSRALEDQRFLSALQLVLAALSRSDSTSLDQVLTPLLGYCSGKKEDYSAAVFVPSCTSGSGFQEVQCQGANCWCVDPRGREVAGSRVSGSRPRCPSHCERERATALKVKGNLAAGAEIYIPACSALGDFLPLQCVGSRCFCVDAEGRRAAAPQRDAISCPERHSQKPQKLVSGGCSQVSAEVAAFREQVRGVAALSLSSHLPLGYGFLLAEGLRLTPEELGLGLSEESLRITEGLLSRSKSALRLAAYSTVQTNPPPQRRSYRPYAPQCDASGHWRHTQCHHSTGQCWCVDEDGGYVHNSLSSRSLSLPRCLTRCQRAQAHTLLSGWMKSSELNTSSSPFPHAPKCEEDGGYSLLQTGGAAGWCVNPVTGEPMQTATRSAAGQLTCPSWCELQGRQCRPDGAFVPLQCDVTSCWCVSVSGQEVSGTRTPRQTGQTPSCDRPVCPSPIVTSGDLVCRPAADGRQSCDLLCHPGYHNALPVSHFLCETESRQWAGDNTPLSGACQISQPLQSWSHSQLWLLSSSCSQIRSLRSRLLRSMTSRGLCTVQLPVSGLLVSVCDESSVRLQCDESLKLTLTWTAALSDLPVSDLPDLRDIALFLNESGLQEGVGELLGDTESTLVSTATPGFGCYRGYHLSTDGEGCVVCPAGSFSREGACLRCPEGTYQDAKGRDFCYSCPRGSSPPGASSVNQCLTECQRRGLRCSKSGNFLPAQPDFLSGRWRCFSSEGAELDWTNGDKALSDEECSVFSRFQAVPGSDLIVGAEDAEVLQMMTSDLKACIQACAVELNCHHVALFNGQTQCELYSTHTLNTNCNTSQQTTGFLGNPLAEVYNWLKCSLKVRGGASDLLVIRKKGAESSSRQRQQSFVMMPMAKALSGVFRTQVFSSARNSLSDAHRFCQDGCSRDTCCDGFTLNSLNGGSLLCDWLRAPSLSLNQDWAVIGRHARGAGLKQQRSSTFTVGEPADSLPESVEHRAVYLSTVAGSTSCAAAELSPLDGSVLQKFQSLSEDDVLVDPQRKLSALHFWLNKKNHDSQQALLWCLTRCSAEPHCFVADLSDSPGFFGCSLFPDSRVCGSYESPLRRRCHFLLHRHSNNTYSKKVDLAGPVKSFYQRVSFQKMVSYSVRSRVSVRENTPLSEGFKECERRCDEDPCCRGLGFVRDTKSAGSHDVVCLSLISLGVQTCGEDDETTWRTRDCRPSAAKTTPDPFGWYLKPVNQWTSSPALCPPFSLPPLKHNVSEADWRLLYDSSVLVDASVSTYDVIHISRDLATDRNQTRDWCLHACQEAESCVAVTLRDTASDTRCILYPDTSACGLSSAPSPSCRLLIKEPAPQVYLRTGRLPLVTSVSIPGHGILRGVAMETTLGPHKKTVVQYLGVPYARPPTGSLRFEETQPPDWMGTWDATKPRPSCVQPGDAASATSSEDCLYLNIFSPAAQRGRVPVLVFFFNPSASENPGILHGSTLAAVGNIVVVTANYRTAALGFLSAGEFGLRGNQGLSDQEAVLRWVSDHISLVGGDNSRVTVGAERQGADITSLHLLSSSSPPLFKRMMLMGGSVFSPSLVPAPASSRRQTLDLARELGCVTSDLAACLRATATHTLNAAQTKLLSVSGPFRSWSPVRPSIPSLRRVDLLLGTSEHDGLIGRARRIKDFEALQGRTDGKTAFYEALSRSLGGATGDERLKEAASWFYSLDHSPSPAGYNLFSRALDNATRDLFITCPSLQMASDWANNQANVFLYHLPASGAFHRADAFVPLDVQLVFGTPHRPIGSQRFTPSERRLSLAAMTYVSSFVRTGNPNPSQMWEESVLPRWLPVQSSEDPPTYLELGPALVHRQGLRQRHCSFWRHMGRSLSTETGETGAGLV